MRTWRVLSAGPGQKVNPTAQRREGRGEVEAAAAGGFVGIGRWRLGSTLRVEGRRGGGDPRGGRPARLSAA